MREISQCMDYNNLRRQLLERATYHGILIWKIDDFERRRKEAVDGVTMSLYSSPFYTSRHGYKMCARVDLNGDGLGKNTHFSFFFVIMRGPYDPRLAWPFRQKVTLTLLNQTGKEHVTDHFRPVPHFSSFQRPGNETEMNIACGCPMFIQIEHLLSGGFVKDDAAYVCIRIEVDTSDLPKIISWILTNLPWILTNLTWIWTNLIHKVTPLHFIFILGMTCDRHFGQSLFFHNILVLIYISPISHLVLFILMWSFNWTWYIIYCDELPRTYTRLYACGLITQWSRGNMINWGTHPVVYSHTYFLATPTSGPLSQIWVSQPPRMIITTSDHTYSNNKAIWVQLISN